MTIHNIAAYKFIDLEQLPALQASFQSKCTALQLKGTILLSSEGINIMLAGEVKNIALFKQWLSQDSRFADLAYKESISSTIPFKRLYVKIKKEIITFGVENIRPGEKRAPSVMPTELKRWLDEKHDIVLLDTRNQYETESGTFENAMDLHLNHFKDFPETIKNLSSHLKEKTIVTFCTGGVRCEKAALYLMREGFKKVYQLDGGILKYFADMGKVHYQGECFVFDDRRVVGIEAIQPA